MMKRKLWGEKQMTYRLGIDLGSASIALALLNENNAVVCTEYQLHKGNIRGVLSGLLEKLETKYATIGECRIAACGAHRIMIQVLPVNEIAALIAGVRHIAPGASSIMEIGSQTSKFIAGLSGENIRFSINDNCSAGTGSFFETQMSRLGIELDEYSSLTDKADAIPGVAGRCSVFAKTDIIHLQQDGEKIENILNGLCYAAARNYKASVAGKLPLALPIVFAGGTVFNSGFLRALKDVFALADNELIIPDYAPVVSAIGAALSADTRSFGNIGDLRMKLKNKKIVDQDRGNHAVLPPLSNPRIDATGSHTVYALNPHDPCVLGIDVGSTSTNLVLIDDSNQVVDFQYLRTKGNPQEAVRQGLQSLLTRFGESLQIVAVATTGSGRHLIGRLVGADAVYDEITAQAESAVHFIPDVDTVFEIGGQDSKFICIENGLVRDFQMNKICAAGTGSFIEEQAAMLNIPLDRYGAIALSAEKPCDLGERCTVFIESNVNDGLSAGAKKEDIAAGLCYSVLANYLNRVVGNKPIGNRILLQGGVAYNPAIVAAFKGKFGSRLVVAPWFSVSGAVGAALLAKKSMPCNKTTFKGLLCLEERQDETRVDKTVIKKEPGLPQQAPDPLLFDYSPERDPKKKTIGIPRALIVHSIFPIFNAFFRALRFNVAISSMTDSKIVELAQTYTQVETCYPVKLAIGHTAQLVQSGVEYIFFPAVKSLMNPFHQTPLNFACVYMQKAPQILGKSLGLKERGISLLSIDIEFEKGIVSPMLLKTLYRLGRKLGRSPAACFYALAKGIKSMMDYMKNASKSEKISPIKELSKDQPVFVMAARGYCVADPALNLGIRGMLHEHGYKMFATGHVNVEKRNFHKQYPNLYWSFGSFALGAAKTIAASENLYAVYPTYHGCGPDALLSHWFEDEMGDKPRLALEIDEHASRIGVITRLEAFVNSVRAHQKTISGQKHPAQKHFVSSTRKAAGFHTSIVRLSKEIPVVIPCLRPYSTLFAACLQGKGYNVLELPPTSPESLAKGRSFMRGKECFSLTALLGDAALYTEHNQRAQLLFPQNQGSEADGLYAYFVYSKLKTKISVVSPSLEQLPRNQRLFDTLFRILLAGDIAINSNSTGLLQTMQATFRSKLPNDETLLQWARDSRQNSKYILFIGEPWCIHNNLFRSIMVKQIETAGLCAAFAPFSEMLLFEGPQQKRSRNVKGFEKLMYNVAQALGENSAFSGFLDHLTNGSCAGVFNGGFGNYRDAKASMHNEHILGIISASSQYENTESILELWSSEKKLPFLNLRFDGESNPVNRLKVDSFLSGIIVTKSFSPPLKGKFF
jgi:predicted CoA-substrate-specific enzyme activase